MEKNLEKDKDKIYLAVHGHFYQPPRENPWIEEIEVQDSAYPEHDWNEKICAQCYSPNSVSRIVDGSNCIIEVSNNYKYINLEFNIYTYKFFLVSQSKCYIDTSISNQYKSINKYFSYSINKKRKLIF